MARKLVASTSPYAPIFGFSRAVRVGNFISVGGTAPMDAHGRTVGIGDPAAQTRQCFETIKASLEQAGQAWMTWFEPACCSRGSKIGR